MAGRTFVERYSVADRVWELTTNSADLLLAARESFPDGLAAPGSPDFHLDISVSGSTGGGAWHRPVCRGRDHLAFCCIGDESAVVFQYRRRIATGSVTRSVAADARYWREIMFPFALGVMSPVLRAVPLHAACVRYRNQGVLLAARSGAGKSTIAATLARRGIEFLSDDWVYLTADRGLRVHALPVPLKLLPDARSFFPELQSMVPAESQNGEWAIAFDPATTFGSPRRYGCEPKVVILFDRVPGAPLRVRRAGTEDLLDWFSEPLDCVPACLQAERQQQIALITALRACRCYVVTCAGTPEEIADQLLRVCDGTIPGSELKTGVHTSQIQHLDLLRRGEPATQLRIGDFEVSVVVESEPWPGPAESFTYENDGVGYISLGRHGLIAFDAAQHESAAFVSEAAVRTGRVHHELQRVCGSFEPAAAATP